MVPNKKLPLQSSTAGNILPLPPQPPSKTIEEIYQKRSQREHILLRPDTYIGSIIKNTQTLWVYENGSMVSRPVTYVPGLYKIFDEILVNAADNKQRDPSMDSLKVEIDAGENRISVYNNGSGIPVAKHGDAKVYVAEMVFGQLLTSSNYDDRAKKTTGGRNGYGAKLTNIFSTEFVVETADGEREKKYKQVFSNNMNKKTNPSITKCSKGENWTRVSFKPDLAKFQMESLEDDAVALMSKRVVDVAGCLGESVKVELNGQQVPVNSFLDYVNLYLQFDADPKTDSIPRFVEKVNDRWEICICVREGRFDQVSFVNGIATVKGGTHVNCVTEQIENYVVEKVHQMKKDVDNIQSHAVKNHLWIFVKALIDNPSFSSQTKMTLTTKEENFGSSCILSDEFLNKVSEAGIVESLLSWADYKLKREQKKADAAKRKRITGIPKLEDANDAGGENSNKCTLILTEGDSAKALAMAGISEVGRNHYGVFPLRGKLLNVREANNWQVDSNEEIQSIQRILGLEKGKQYDCVESLRYGHLMIMTDQDHDGSHIKGLLINFIHTLWPSLLRIPSFLLEFITPIVKATQRSGVVLSFYSMPEYESWKESLQGNTSGWSIKYYKGLGTSTSKEGKEYFQGIESHRKDFAWLDDKDGAAIELAFSKNKIEARKNWLRKFEPGTYLDQKEKHIRYRDFVNKELILFSMADLQRSIPSVVDGLKPGQRKILFCSFKRNFFKEAKVAQFSGYVSEHSAYHHGEQSLASTIVGMAQDYVGSNNINLLQPNGQFGTRHQGGKDHASARYIYTCLSPFTRVLFPKNDDLLLNYLNDDGQSIEPTWYMPIIPMVLVNGAEGIGTGWSTYIPNYNPRNIISNVRKMLDGKPMEPMDPWYRGFRGTIEKTTQKGSGASYTVTGIIEEVNKTIVRITELPVRKSTEEYKQFLDSIMKTSSKKNELFIKDFKEYNDDTNVDFEISLSEKTLSAAKEEGLAKKFKLTTTISTSNMHLFDPKGVLKKYETPEEILEEFFHLRLEFYGKRKEVLLNVLQSELLKLENKVRFIEGVVDGDIIVTNRKRADLFFELKQKGFAQFQTKIIELGVSGGTEGNGENGYDYLVSIPIGTLILEKVRELRAERDKINGEVDDLKKATPMSLWTKDLDALEKELDGNYEAKVEVMNGSSAKVSREAPKKPRRSYAKKANNVETTPKPVIESVTPAAEIGKYFNHSRFSSYIIDSRLPS
ncbi:DNA topoisomerase 2-like isoform X1 [Rhododendron vialii]|uniref:DNA topoisomerase 2-like isoform X1 n=1 Tax=Rhododendron vialii TaxID=182163 RepID=UPI00265E3579|nr:DNA topoisomerase 2-like isoform X1 [Rhododendron vialii]